MELANADTLTLTGGAEVVKRVDFRSGVGSISVGFGLFK
jgi:hypothetical protein